MQKQKERDSIFINKLELIRVMAKKTVILTESEMTKLLTNIVEEVLDESQQDCLLTEMAKVKIVYDKKIGYVIAIWGDLLNDRTVPHVHIWKASDANNKYKNFNLELSLIDILVNDKLVLLRKTDTERNIDEVGRTENWTPYNSIKRVIIKAFADENADLLGKLIYTWNIERDIEKTDKGGNPLKEWMDERNLKPLPKYEKYF